MTAEFLGVARLRCMKCGETSWDLRDLGDAEVWEDDHVEECPDNGWDRIDPAQAWLLFQQLLLDAGAEIRCDIPQAETDLGGEAHGS